jgi:hypothetical protein
MNAKYFEAFAAIAPSHLAGIASPAVDIRIDSAPVARLDSILIFRRLKHNSREFMAEHTGVDIGWVAARERMEIRSTDPDPADGKDYFTLDRNGLGHIPPVKRARSSQDYLLHAASNWINHCPMRKYGIAILDGQGLSDKPIQQ